MFLELFSAMNSKASSSNNEESNPLDLIFNFNISISVCFSGFSIETDKPWEKRETNLSSKPSSWEGVLSDVITICLFCLTKELKMLKNIVEVPGLLERNWISSISKKSIVLKKSFKDDLSLSPWTNLTNSSTKSSVVMYKTFLEGLSFFTRLPIAFKRWVLPKPDLE